MDTKVKNENNELQKSYSRLMKVRSFNIDYINTSKKQFSIA